MRRDDIPAMPPEWSTPDKIAAFEAERRDIEKMPKRKRQCNQWRLDEINRQLRH